VLQDLKTALRLLVKDPAFTAVAVLVLALGIGANTAVFSLVNALMLQPTPGEGPGVVGIFSRDRTRPDSYRAFSWPAFEQIRASREPFESVFAHTLTLLGATEGDTTRRSFSSIVSASYFSTLGVRLAAGREFTAEEERPGSDQRVVIVAHQYARKAGVAPAELLGRTVRLNARDFTIVGVAPEGFGGTLALVGMEFWIPLGVYDKVSDEMFRDGQSEPLGHPQARPLMLIGRLKPGVSLDAATPPLATLSRSLEQSDPVENKNHELSAHRLSRQSISTSPPQSEPFGVLSLLLMGTAGLVLLIACLNLANMLLARGTARRKEVALRLALGSGRARVVRQLLIESLTLAVLGSVAGLLLALWGTRLLFSSFAAVLPLVVTYNPTPDIRVLAATVAFCLLSALIAGVGPAWRVTRPDVLPDLKEQPAEQKRARRISMRNALVVGQIALSLALLTAAGLFMRGALKAGAADPGFPLEGGVIANINPGMVGYDEARTRAAIRDILRQVRSTPGVHAASLATLVPFGEFQEGRLLQKAGTPPAGEGQTDAGSDGTFTIVGADYFDTLRLPLLRGRGFTPAEEESGSGLPVLVIDEPLARELFPNEDPIGQRVQFARRDATDARIYTIVGLVAGVRHDLFDPSPVPHVYAPIGQHYRGNLNLHVRLAGGDAAAESAMLGTLRQVIRSVDPQVPVMQLRTLGQQRDRSLMLWAVNTGARLFSVFGAVALLLAVIGIYGVKSYVVSRRTREIGIRMALGATPSNVLWLVLREGLMLTLVGVSIGLVIAWGVAKALSGLLYQVSALDPLVFAIAPLLLSASALLASYLPARRATRVLPLTALRTE
jgi:predicted permease